MLTARLIAFSLALAASPVLAAQETDMGKYIAPGKWALAYSRTGEFKPLRYRKKESGTSYACINGDPRKYIVDWITGKGCTISKESQTGSIYRLEGQCRLSWWKNHPIPVSIELRAERAGKFSLDIKTRSDAVLGFSERTTATRIGPCDTASASEPKQDQQPKN